MQKIPFNNALALDIGDRRIGLARGSSVARLAEGLPTLAADGNELATLKKLVHEHEIDLLVIGLPRNQSGELTKQSKKIMSMAEHLAKELGLPLVFQDESLTSVEAEKLLHQRSERYDRGAVDQLAAELILQDFLDQPERF